MKDENGSRIEIWEMDCEVMRKLLYEIEEAIQHPPCCHVSGTHDPLHFKKDPTQLCDIQMRRAYLNVVKILDIRADDLRALSSPDCCWCNDKHAESHEPRLESPAPSVGARHDD
jgi:hypothetical protein